MWPTAYEPTPLVSPWKAVSLLPPQISSPPRTRMLGPFRERVPITRGQERPGIAPTPCCSSPTVPFHQVHPSRDPVPSNASALLPQPPNPSSHYVFSPSEISSQPQLQILGDSVPSSPAHRKCPSHLGVWGLFRRGDQGKGFQCLSPRSYPRGKSWAQSRESGLPSTSFTCRLQTDSSRTSRVFTRGSGKQGNPLVTVCLPYYHQRNLKSCCLGIKRISYSNTRLHSTFSSSVPPHPLFPSLFQSLKASPISISQSPSLSRVHPSLYPTEALAHVSSGFQWHQGPLVAWVDGNFLCLSCPGVRVAWARCADRALAPQLYQLLSRTNCSCLSNARSSHKHSVDPAPCHDLGHHVAVHVCLLSCHLSLCCCVSAIIFYIFISHISPFLGFHPLFHGA